MSAGVTADLAGGTAPSRIRIATAIVFLIAGIAIAVWAALVPFVRQRLALDDATLGLLLLCPGIGSLCTMPLAGRLSGRFGPRPVIGCCGLLVCATLPLLAFAPARPVLALSLLLLGAAFGALDVAMNVQAVAVEAAARRPLMSGFHGLYSAGGIVGACCMSGLFWAGASPLAAAALLGALLAGLLAAAAAMPGWSRPEIAPDRAERRRLWPAGAVLAIGLLCAACFLAEGGMVDWSALLLGRIDGLRPTWTGLGYAAFSATMTVGRFCGDGLVRRLGARVVLVSGAGLACAGLLAASLSGSWPLALAGFALTGLGSSNLVPLLIGAAGRQGPRTGMMSADAVAAASTLGYAGILVGPALLGLVARVAGLQSSFLLLALLLACVPLGTRLVAGRR